MDLTQQMLEEKMNSLPADIQRAITDDSVLENIRELGVKYKLRLDKTGLLVNEVGLVMLGLKQSSDFIASLSKQLEIDRETAESLAVDVDNEVFRKIRESLRTVQFTEDKPEEVPVADPDYGDSPARDSLLQELERHGNVEVGSTSFTSGDDYSADSFGSAAQSPTPASAAYAPTPTPFEQAVISEEEKLDPTKTFKDHLEKKVAATNSHVNADPYKESIE